MSGGAPENARAGQIAVLTLVDYYLPGYKGGGPLRTVQNMVAQLGHEFAFRVLTRDHDCGDPAPYEGLEPQRWYGVGQGEVRYLRSAEMGLSGLRKVLRETPHDVLYLNSFFSPRLTIWPLLLRWLRLIPRRAVVIAPRGELHPGALATGSWGAWLPTGLARHLPSPRQLKKQGYIALCRMIGLYRGVLWHASNEEERTDIRRRLGRATDVHVAPNLAAAPPAPDVTARTVSKEPGELRAIFISRIDSKKNLDGALEVLQDVRGRVTLHIFGPVEDEAYWTRCQALIRRLPPNVSARYHGSLPHERVAATLRDHHLLFFPTHGENFGHIISEALTVGCPVLISDRTPWRNLEQLGIGWDLPLDQRASYVAALERCVAMDDREWRQWSVRAAAHARQRSLSESVLQSNRELFRRAVAAATAGVAH